MTDKNAVINLRLQQLRDAFNSSLPARFSMIDALWQKIQRQRVQHNEYADELCRAVHTLAGSAGTFEQPQLGRVARHLEQNLNRIFSSHELLTALDVSLIDKELSALKHSVMATTTDGGSTHEESQITVKSANGLSIALLEDDKVLAREMAEQLAIYGYRVQCCSNLNELEAAFAQQSFAAVLADVELAEGSLTSPALYIRLIHLCQHGEAIIFISIRDDWVARLTAVRIGAVAYFKKPVDCGVIANCLSHIVAPEQQEKKRILIVEDQVELAEHYAEVLRDAGMTVEILAEPAEVLDVINRLHPDLILMDVYMPTCTGLELTGIIRQIEAYQGIPIVFLSVEPIKEKQHSAMLLGADDFLQKPISNNDLVYAVSHRAERFKFLNKLMVCDSLTGLLNHAMLKTQLDILQAQVLRKQGNLCFVMLDIDLFKNINDRYGHPKGDVVIRSLAHLLQKHLRTIDVIGRYGGEEFAIILPDTDAKTAFAIIDDLRENFEKITHYHEDSVFNATFSAGISMTQSNTSAQSLINSADAALYIAKHQGRNRVIMSTQ